MQPKSGRECSFVVRGARAVERRGASRCKPGQAACPALPRLPGGGALHEYSHRLWWRYANRRAAPDGPARFLKPSRIDQHVHKNEKSLPVEQRSRRLSEVIRIHPARRSPACLRSPRGPPSSRGHAKALFPAAGAEAGPNSTGCFVAAGQDIAGPPHSSAPAPAGPRASGRPNPTRSTRRRLRERGGDARGDGWNPDNTLITACYSIPHFFLQPWRGADGGARRE